MPSWGQDRSLTNWKQTKRNLGSHLSALWNGTESDNDLHSVIFSDQCVNGSFPAIVLPVFHYRIRFAD
jgi:hypothetical protein